jgi:hypothetical protein
MGRLQGTIRLRHHGTNVLPQTTMVQFIGVGTMVHDDGIHHTKYPDNEYYGTSTRPLP